MLSKPSSHVRAVLQALFVTFLWSTSWVLIKFGLRDIPALTFAGLRYTLAFLCLLPFALRPAAYGAIRSLSLGDWLRLFLLGFLFYAVTQGAQFVGLAYLPAITVSLLLNFTSVLVAWLGIVFLDERLTLLQWAGIGLFLAGLAAYFYPVSVPYQQAIGLGVVVGGVAANAFSSVLGRRVNRDEKLHPLVVTTISMGMGSLLLLATGISLQGLPRFSLANWLIVLWLAVVNTAFAFTLWNQTLRTLSAIESSIINSTMLVQIAVLAWIFLDESLGWLKVAGLILSASGALVVQLRRPKSPQPITSP